MNEQKYINIIGAKENNLKNIDLKLPKYNLIVMTGVSGSGKTSLAFDTIYQEGQRRYVESLSTYARQFLGNFEKPKVDKIEGLSPSISIDQRTTSQNPRSTVGTVTEIYDFYRLLYSKIGIPYSMETNLPLTKQTIDEMRSIIMQYEVGSKIIILSPIVERKKGQFQKLLDSFLQKGFNRVFIDNILYTLDDIPEIDKNKFHNIELVIDRLILNDTISHRLYEALETACNNSNGRAQVLINDNKLSFNQDYQSHGDDISIKLEPRLFSFNIPLGACSECKGLGFKMKVDPELILDMDKSILNGGIIPYKNADDENLIVQELVEIAKYYNILPNKKLRDYNNTEINLILYGSSDTININLKSKSGKKHSKTIQFEGLISYLENRYLQTTSDWIREWIQGFMREQICPTCSGARLNKSALSVKIDNINIYQLCSMSIKDEIIFLTKLEEKLTNTQKEISNLILREILDRLTFLQNVGLDYLNLSRMAQTLSGGESQRIRLATQIGSKLSGVLYVLDEPSIGLHQKDNKKLIQTLKQMRDLGNTLIVVEHDLETMMESDYIVDIGPLAGDEGGYVTAFGTPNEIIENENSLTGKYLSNKINIETPKKRRDIKKTKYIEIKNASENNLKNINVKIYTNIMTIITGVSGSGKSSLINQTLLNFLKNKYYSSKNIIGKNSKIDDHNLVSKIVEISQSPIGRTPRSNPATYTGVFDDIRDLFSLTTESKKRGYLKGRFSFNVKGGRCEVCHGDGVKKITMHFLPDVYVKCEACNGMRYNRETLDILFKSKNISDILEMTVKEGVDFFKNHPKIYNKLSTLLDVGLGYIKLGQSAPTLSGGEAQRVKLASELYKKPDKKTLYILDEPTTGLHNYDVSKLLKVLHKIVDNGASMIIIEHNLDVIKQADYIIDLGPDGGDNGGYIVAQGTPEEVSNVLDSYTGQYLKEILDK